MKYVDSSHVFDDMAHTVEANEQLDARQALSDTDRDDICSDPFDEGCMASLDDGEGWDGACGNCADRQAAADEEEQGWQDGADDENNGEGSDR
ncbi:MAG: hypothetical protein K2X52_00260 [Mycobacteriaceae bacterium]|jgi:hypothetical protein|nr:hypothetical protein [Mycobacteriaceae bacterium]